MQKIDLLKKGKLYVILLTKQFKVNLEITLKKKHFIVLIISLSLILFEILQLYIFFFV